MMQAPRGYQERRYVQCSNQKIYTQIFKLVTGYLRRVSENPVYNSVRYVFFFQGRPGLAGAKGDRGDPGPQVFQPCTQTLKAQKSTFMLSSLFSLNFSWHRLGEFVSTSSHFMTDVIILHCHLLGKKSQVLSIEVETMTCRLLVRMHQIYHWATGDSWQLRLTYPNAGLCS